MAQTPSPLWRLQPSAQDQAWGLFVTAVGSGAGLPPLSGSGWRLHVLVRGSAGLLLPGRRPQRLEAGEVLLLDALGEAELVPEDQSPCRIHFVDFDGAWMERWIRAGFFAPLPRVIRTGFDEHLLGLIVRLVDLARNQPPDVGRLLGGALGNLLARLESASRQGSGAGRQHDLVAEARHLLSDPEWDHTRLEALADEVGVSYSWFRRSFRTHTGLSPQRFRDQQRLDRACQLLADPGLSVGAVAAAMGFSSQAYFARVFRKETGLAPSVWRASQLGKK